MATIDPRVKARELVTEMRERAEAPGTGSNVAQCLREGADALEALLPGDEDRESDAKVMPVSFEASAACSHGTCPNGCSHLMWQCSACSSEGGWGAPREKLETWAADHSCSTLPASSGETNRDGLAQVALAHVPVLGVTGRVVGCRCMDRVFVQHQETWAEHIAAAVSAHLEKAIKG